MNKADLINAVAQTGLTKADSKKAVDAVISACMDALKNGDRVSLVGFGTLMVAERSARTGINPATKEAIAIPAKKVVKFKAGAELNDLIK